MRVQPAETIEVQVTLRHRETRQMTHEDVAWLPFNHDWPSRIQALWHAVQGAYAAYSELGDLRPVVPAQAAELERQQIAAYHEWRQLDDYVAEQIAAWEGEVQG